MDKETTGSVVKNVSTAYDAAGLPTAAADAATGETVAYAHDPIGNLTGVDSSIAANNWTYAYDPYSRLTCAVQATSCDSGSTRVLFAMDALDRALTRMNGSSVTSLTYQGIAESVAKTATGSTTTTYAHTGGGAPLAEQTGSNASFYLRDPHGDVVGLASTAAANLGTAAFDPWGRSLTTTGQTSFLGYQGDMTDPDTKQVDMGTRWYSAGLGRFSTRDVLLGELTSPMTLNQHVYGAMNPITMWDPTGMYMVHGGGGGGCGTLSERRCKEVRQENEEIFEQNGGVICPWCSPASGSHVSPKPPAPEPPRPVFCKGPCHPSDRSSGGDESGGCGFWCRIGDGARFLINLPLTGYSAGIATLTGHDCRFEAHLQVACYGEDDEVDRAITFGNTFVTNARRGVVDDELRAHELAHSTQWAILGPPRFIVFYAEEAARSALTVGPDQDLLCNSWFEGNAGLEVGGYDC